jgi:hypothetical protein
MSTEMLRIECIPLVKFTFTTIHRNQMRHCTVDSRSRLGALGLPVFVFRKTAVLPKPAHGDIQSVKGVESCI